jgi:hypothetical protein
MRVQSTNGFIFVWCKLCRWFDDIDWNKTGIVILVLMNCGTIYVTCEHYNITSLLCIPTRKLTNNTPVGHLLLVQRWLASNKVFVHDR